MAQHDYDIANQSGAAFRSDLNNALDAIVTTNSGSTEPATTFAFQFWADTNANQLKMRNAANDGWIVILETDGEVPAKTFTGDITLNAQSDLRFADSDSSNWVAFQSPATVSSNVTWTLPDADATTSGQALVSDASGTLSWAAVSGDISDTAPERTFTNTTEEDTDGGRENKITFKGEQSGGEVSTLAQIEASHDGTSDDEKGKIIFRTNDGSDGSSPTSRVEIDSQGKFFIGDFGEPSNKNSVTPSFILSANGVSGAAQITRHTTVGGGGGLLELSSTRGTSNTDYTVLQSGDGIGTIDFLGADGDEFVVAAAIQAQVDGTPGADDMPGRLMFHTTADGASSPTERMRIDSSGNALVAKTSDNYQVAGFQANSDGLTMATRSGAAPFLANRLSNDGNLIEFYQASSLEGGISVSGSTVSYVGGHLARWSQLASGADRTEILRGSVLSNLDEMCEWGEEENEQLNRMKVSDVEGDRNVSGVFQSWDDDDDTYTNDFYCAMTGDFVIRIAQGTTVARGDLLMSAGDGTAKPQDDDIVRAKTIAKVTSTTVSTTYDDGSYCVPCVLMAC
tara:strand:- start:2220 stop:3920 length:1701 start_codon:yes stop_codon:yes gene_type:complete